MKTVLLIGNSIFMSGLAPVLQKSEDFLVHHGESRQFSSLPETDVILIDLCDSDVVQTLPQLCTLNAPVIGIHPAQGTLMVLSGKSQAVHSIQDILNFLQLIATRKVSDAPPDEKKDPSSNRG